MIEGSDHGRVWEFFPSPSSPDQLWGPPSLQTNGYQGLFSWEWSGRGVKLTTLLLLVTRSRMRGAIRPLPSLPSWRGDQFKVQGRHLCLYLYRTTGKVIGFNIFQCIRLQTEAEW